MKSKKMFLTSLVFGSMMTLSAQAQYAPAGGPLGGAPQITITGNGPTTVNINNPSNYTIPGGADAAGAFYDWCDTVVEDLGNQAALANGLYQSQRYAEAKQVMIAAFIKARDSFVLSGRFRPMAHTEIARTVDLLSALESVPSANQTLHDNVVAYTALNRVDFVIRVKNELDRPYVIPCAAGCGNYGDNELQEYQMKLAQVAGEQLQAVLGYSAMASGSWVYPAGDTNTFMTIVQKTAQWAAYDLSNNLFPGVFACAIKALNTVTSEGQQERAFWGEKIGVRFVYYKVGVIASEIQSDSHGCNGFPYNEYSTPRPRH